MDIEAKYDVKVVSRNNQVRAFDRLRIDAAVTKAFAEFFGANYETAEKSSAISARASRVTDGVLTTILKSEKKIVSVEEIQDLVELELETSGEREVARLYIRFRDKKSQERAVTQGNQTISINAVANDGQIVSLDLGFYRQLIQDASEGLADIDTQKVWSYFKEHLYDGVSVKEVDEALVLSPRSFTDESPDYSDLCARLTLLRIRQEVFETLGSPVGLTTLNDDYGNLFVQAIDFGIKHQRLNPELGEFDLRSLSKAIVPERDRKLTFLSVLTLYDRYLLHENEHRYELPQFLFMRVAMGLALNESANLREVKAIEFYNVLSNFDFMSSTPTLFNSGTVHSQMSSCFISTVEDDLWDIYQGLAKNSMMQKFAGGVGNDYTNVRAMGARIKGTNGKSQGVIPFLKVINDTAVAVNQGGKRKGAVCAYLETWHLDILEFLDLRKNTGDDRRRTHDMNTANWIPDLFMERVADNGDWTLFSPNDTPELHGIYGNAFREKYIACEKAADSGEIELFKRMPAVDLWRKMVTMLFETGHPWLTFKDPCNLRSPQQHAGVVHSSNLCTEITLNTSRDEIAVCNLGSVNLANHIHNGKLDLAKLGNTVCTAMRMLDNVIDLNYYNEHVPEARNANMRHRPVGLGLMGFSDALQVLGIPAESDEAIAFADYSMEAISYYAIAASTNLAESRGKYESFDGSLWSQGILPIDSINVLKAHRAEADCEMTNDRSGEFDWDTLRNRVKTVGMRNSNCLAIAPTATISNICGVSQSIEPTYQNLYTKSNLSGEFTVINRNLVNVLKERGLWNKAVTQDLKHFDGSVENLSYLPDDVRAMFKTAFEIDPIWLVRCAAARQKWIDQAQSLNLYMKQPSGKKLSELYQAAWRAGLKTTYYLRSEGATSVEKSTSSSAKQLNAVSHSAPKACSIDDPDCEACQ